MNRFLCGIVLALSISVQSAVAFDHNFPKDTDRSVFFELLKRPDAYPRPCCGASDAYEADIYKRNPDGSYEVTITDGSEITYPDGVHRIGLPNGATVHVPASRINPPIETQHNPTGH